MNVNIGRVHRGKTKMLLLRLIRFLTKKTNLVILGILLITGTICLYAMGPSLSRNGDSNPGDYDGNLDALRAQWGAGDGNRALAALQRNRLRKGHLILSEEEEMEFYCRAPMLEDAKSIMSREGLKLEHPQCDTESLFYTQNGELHLSLNTLKGRTPEKCEYVEILWGSDSDPLYADVKIRNESPFIVNLETDFYMVDCHLDADAYDGKAKRLLQKKKILQDEPEPDEPEPDEDEENPDEDDENDDGNEEFDNSPGPFFVAKIHPHPKVLEKVKEILETATTELPKMNVLTLFLHGVSRWSFFKYFPNTANYLSKELGAVFLRGYNTLGNDPGSNLIPLLTGKSVHDVSEVHKGHAGFVDTLPLIWNKYEEKGYVTMFAEDSADKAVFNHHFNGFEDPPTDHYMRPFWQAIQDAGEDDGNCIGGTPRYQYLLDYVRLFFQKYPNVAKFGFAILHQPPVEQLDNDIVGMLKYLKASGDLDNTLLVVTSNHGNHGMNRSLSDKLEERMPVAALAFPPKFHKENEKLIEQLHPNMPKLTTPYDLHETLLSLLHLERLDKSLNPKLQGISLLRSIPLNRTCESAGVPLQWCSCVNWEQADHNLLHTSQIRTAAKHLVDGINMITALDRDICQTVQLEKIVDAKLLFLREDILIYLDNQRGGRLLSNLTSEYHPNVWYYQVAFTVSPGENTLFEGTVRYNVKIGEFRVMSEISRLDNTERCKGISRMNIEKYCFCKS